MSNMVWYNPKYTNDFCYMIGFPKRNKYFNDGYVFDLILLLLFGCSLRGSFYYILFVKIKIRKLLSKSLGTINHLKLQQPKGKIASSTKFLDHRGGCQGTLSILRVDVNYLNSPNLLRTICTQRILCVSVKCRFMENSFTTKRRHDSVTTEEMN